MPEIKNTIDKIVSTEWPIIFNLFDQCILLSDVQQSEKIGVSDLSKSAQIMLQRMLSHHNKPFILNRTIDPLVEQLLGQEATTEYLNPAEIIGRSFGPWRAVTPLGSGGMGQVFTAERADGQYEKQVALKIIKSGHFSALSKQRFLDEMRTLAQFEHPNIAHLIDGGTSDDGIGYFVMERVSGQPIVDYANNNKLSITARIKLILQAIDAVEYAHQNLIIHGDIKPANLLVNKTGQIKLVDFGIARPVQTDDVETYLPQFTPSYSSPEQAQGKPLTTASDVFGLCAVLYEICTDSTPRKRESVTTHLAFNEQLNEPITPVFDRYQRQKKYSKNDRYSILQDNSLSHALARELGAIIDKGLQLNPSNRYKNTTELCRDLNLFLDGSAVPTYATSWRYRWWKSIIKYKWPVTLSTLAMVAIIMVAMVAVNQARLANQEAQKANWAKDFVLGIFDKADPVKNQQNPITVNELTQQAADRLLLEGLDYAPEVKLTSLALLGNIQYKLGQAESASLIHKKYLALLQNAVKDSERIANAHFELAKDYLQMGQFNAALEQFKNTRDFMPFETKVTHIGAMALQSIALTELRLNNIESAGDAIAALKRHESEILKADQPFQTMTGVAFAEARFEIAQKNYTAALEAIQRAQSYANKLTDDPIRTAEHLSTTADIYSYLKQYELSVKAGQEAVDIFKVHYGTSHPETLIALSNHASNLGHAGHHIESIDLYQEIINIIKDLSVPDFYQPIMLQNLAHQYRKNGQHTKAIESFNQAVPLWQSLQQPNPMGLASTYSGLARSYFALGELETANLYFNKTLQTVEQQQGTDSSSYATFLLMKVPLLIEQSKTEELKIIFPKIYKTLSEKHGEESSSVAKVYLLWAQFLGHQGDLTAAKQKAQLAHDIYLNLSPIENHEKSLTEAKKYLTKGNNN